MVAILDLNNAGILTLLILLAGCAGPRDSVNRDGPAARAALGYYTALLAGDSDSAWQSLHPETSKRLGKSGFEKRAKNLKTTWNITDATATVTSSQERPDNAVVHVALRGNRNGKSVRLTDGVTLKLDGETWRVWLK
jgi:hypothetical protein